MADNLLYNMELLKTSFDNLISSKFKSRRIFAMSNNLDPVSVGKWVKPNDITQPNLNILYAMRRTFPDVDLNKLIDETMLPEIRVVKTSLFAEPIAAYGIDAKQKKELEDLRQENIELLKRENELIKSRIKDKKK